MINIKKIIYMLMPNIMNFKIQICYNDLAVHIKMLLKTYVLINLHSEKSIYKSTITICKMFKITINNHNSLLKRFNKMHSKYE